MLIGSEDFRTITNDQDAEIGIEQPKEVIRIRHDVASLLYLLARHSGEARSKETAYWMIVRTYCIDLIGGIRHQYRQDDR